MSQPSTMRSAHRAGSADVNEWVRRWRQHGDRDARDAVFDQFTPLARRLAGRYRNAHEPHEDLCQVAAIGLLAAIDRFDPDRGVRFQSFAIPTILGELKRSFRNSGWSAHVPRSAQELAQRVERASRELAEGSGGAVRVLDLAALLDIETQEVLVGLEAAKAHFAESLDTTGPGGDEPEPQSLADRLGHDDEGFGLVDITLSVEAAVARLPHAERIALRLRIDHDLKQAEIAREMGCSQMHVSRLLRRAVDRIRAVVDPPLTSPTTQVSGDRPRVIDRRRVLAV